MFHSSDSDTWTNFQALNVFKRILLFKNYQVQYGILLVFYLFLTISLLTLIETKIKQHDFDKIFRIALSNSQSMATNTQNLCSYIWNSAIIIISVCVLLNLTLSIGKLPAIHRIFSCRYQTSLIWI